ncbi:MAG: EAL domain-containing protein [Gammaproteobacteria bacterium]|jgi:diguanylate cyclase (GGDEF)-like protein|nr:EAL domain-containing protein [Gammaproteobacteria bacterium]
MNPPHTQNAVFDDYAAFLNALLPQAEGFLFHDRHGRLFWNDRAPDTSLFDAEYHEVLRKILTNGSVPGESARIPLRDQVAYLLRLLSDKGQTLGVLTAIVPRDIGGMPHQFCSDLLKPAVRSMERELSLRVHLLDANRKLSRHGEEYGFLRVMGEFARREEGRVSALGEILGMCLEELEIDGITLYVPEFRLAMTAGTDAPSEFSASLALQALQDQVMTAHGNLAEALAAEPATDSEQRQLVLPVLQSGQRLAGVLVLQRSRAGRPYQAKTKSIASFVTTTLEHMLEKTFDAVTGLMNWRNFEHALEELGGAEAGSTTLAYLDIDQLQVANDTFGRYVGDDMLREMARLLRDILPDAPVTRITSDSFAALLRDTELGTARELFNEFCARAKKFEHVEGDRSYRMSVSVGLAPLAVDAGATASVLAPAQIACQAAKERGCGRVEVYEAGDASIVQRLDDLMFSGSIRSAIEGGRLVLFAQPLHRLTGSQDVAYHELLVRMLNTAGEPVPPAEFMGAAERYQLMQDLDRWVVHKAIETLTDQHTDSSGRPLKFAINLSGQSLGSERFRQFVQHELDQSGLPGERLCFEITETVAVRNLKNAQRFMAQFRELGCEFALDDFGTGLSSFAYLKLFPVNTLKIDGSFVSDIATNEVSRSMVSAVAEIARVMSLETVAEYVQDEATLAVIRELGIDWAQGYHLGEPVRLSKLFAQRTVVDKAELADVDPALLKMLPD